MKKIFLIGVFMIGYIAFGQVYDQGIVTGPMTTTEINAISSPQEGRQVYNETTQTIWFYDGTSWVDSGTASGIQTTDIDTFAELDAIVADKSLVNLEDNQTFSGAATFTNSFALNPSSSVLPGTVYMDTPSIGVSGVYSTAGLGSVFFDENGNFNMSYSTSLNDGVTLELNTFAITSNKSMVFTDSDVTYNGTSLLSGGSGDLWSDPVDADIVPDTDDTYDLGSQASSFSQGHFDNNLYANSNLILGNNAYIGVPDGVSGRRWSVAAIGELRFGYQTSANTSEGGSYSTLYSLDESGTPSAATDLIDIGFLQSGLDDLATIDASAFSGNLTTSDDTLQEIADALDGLSTGGGSSPPFDANSAILQDETDNTKLLNWDLSGLTTATTRTITMPDADVNLGSFDATNIANGTVSNTAFQHIANLAENAQQQIDSKFNITGGSITGNINFLDTYKAINLADPVNPQDAVTLNHLNNTFGANNLKSEPESRTNEETYSNVIGQPYADSQTDGAAPPGTLVLEFDVPPAFISSGTTLNMDDYRGYNTGVSSVTSYILAVPEVGGFVYAFVNAASEPSFDGSGIGVTVINPVDSLAFIPNDNMLGIVWMLTSTTAMQWWIDIP